ncbi:hypothetical protein MASR1M8_13430 [Thermomonas brevis]
MDEAYAPTGRSAGSNKRCRRAWFSAYRPINQPNRLIRGTDRWRDKTRLMPRSYTGQTAPGSIDEARPPGLVWAVASRLRTSRG